uniref:NADH-ubiquinone oxidoreductase chain 6 n=1 Tax=Rheocricotopus villiculus TaxID=2781637 RepID=A0A8A9WQW3_9DIPT|nr:NADH dehydrogenase subunit 6 [Rheocricotopus villiculus]QTT60916.1 NADH dehydrogenase subunit 6 [Rheocricotopus villiculus]
MFYFILNFLNIISASTFSLMKHPLAMGIMLLWQTILISLMSGIISYTFWFSYILFLIFLGGMLVLFMYVTSLASNEMFNFSMKLIWTNSFMFFLLLMLIIVMDNSIFMNYLINFETQNLLFMMNFQNENSLMLNKLYNFPNNFITISVMIYLFLTLIAVVKITNIFEGPLRPNL